MNITAELFYQHVGHEPQDDDLERCNCAKAGQQGHMQCGWNRLLNLPVFMAGLEADCQRAAEMADKS